MTAATTPRPTVITCCRCGEIVAVHPTGRIPTKCPLCRLGTVKQRLVELDVMPMRAREHECPRCGQRFSNLTNLHGHVSREHLHGGMALITVHLPPAVMDWLDCMVDAGVYPNRSEAIRATLYEARSRQRYRT